MKTKTSDCTCLLAAVALMGCGEPEPPPVSPPASPPAANNLSAMLSGEVAPPPAMDTASGMPAQVEVPTYEGDTEAERLTWALRAYYDDPNRPAISTFEPLVEKRLIRSVPVPPPGKQFVIDLARAEVRLEDRK